MSGQRKHKKNEKKRKEIGDEEDTFSKEARRSTVKASACTAPQSNKTYSSDFHQSNHTVARVTSQTKATYEAQNLLILILSLLS